MSVAFATSLLVLAGCAARDPLPELQDARSEVQAAAQSPDAEKAAALRLKAAREALNKADAAFESGKEDAVVAQYAYVAKRNAEIAQEQTAAMSARQAVESAEAERNKVLLESRTMEADQARAAAQMNAGAARSARDDVDRLQQQLKDLEAKQTDRGMVLTLGDVLFDTDKAVVKPGARNVLDRVANFLAENDGFKVMVEGHTDSRGSDAYNQDLSARRANGVRDVLMQNGVSSNRIQSLGLGEAYPVATNDTTAGRQQNRRVEIIFSDTQGEFARGARRM